MLSFEWKYRELIAALGGPQGVFDILEHYGFQPPPLETIKGWRLRNSIPGKYVPALLMIALEERALKKLSHLFKGTGL